MPNAMPTSVPYSRFYAKSYFPSLDGLRALSIVPVVWHHCTPHTYPGILGRGAVGVDLFFAISGFLITTLLWRERHRDKGVDLAGFYVRRSARIFPLYFLVLALNVLYAMVVRPDWEPSRRFLRLLPYYATYTANWVKSPELSGPALFVFAWSLCTEEQFYAFWAPLMKASRRLSWAAYAMGLWLVLDLLLESNLLAQSTLVPREVRVVLTSFATPIGVGALLALLLHHPRCSNTVLRFASPAGTAPLLLALVLSSLVWPWAPLFVLHGVLGLLVLACAVPERHGLSTLLDHPALGYLGRISYGIYLWHVAVIGGVKVLLPGLVTQPGWLFVLACPLSVLVAALSYRYFEQPMIRQVRLSYGAFRSRRSATAARVQGS